MKTFDSTLSFFVNQLDNLDSKLYEPLSSVTWGRDINVRSGLTLGNESTSFIRSTFGAVGTSNAQGKPWIGSANNTLPGVSINGDRVVTPLRLLGQEVTYSSVELERSQLLGQPIDTQKFNALNTIYQMTIDEQVYIGDTAFGALGLVNSNLVTTGSVVNGASASPLWANKTPDEILRDVNTLIEAAWLASGYTVCPDKLLLPPTQYALIAGRTIGTAGSVSILTFLEDNSISLRVNGRKLDIQPSKWLTGRGAGSTNRMVVYTNAENYVRFPMVPIRRETPYYLGINFNSPYLWALGDVEFVYPQTVRYADGI